VKKIFWLVTTALIVVAMMLSACKTDDTAQQTTTAVTGTVKPTGTTTTTAPPTTTTTTTAAPTKDPGLPQYGGTITFVLAHQKATDYFDPVVSAIGGHIGNVTYDKLISADWGKGPQGTGENPFLASHHPEDWRTGMLAETWEKISNSEVIFHIRKGVNFQTKAPANGREMKAADVVYSFQRGQKDPRWTGYGFREWTDTAAIQTWRNTQKANGRTDAELDAWEAELKAVKYPFHAASYMVATDSYTVKYRLFTPYPGIIDVASWLFVFPSESTSVDLGDWRNACGTGAWIVQDAVSASSVTWRANPNYWMSDPNHPENKLPYADTLRGLIIIEESTQLASLRTHKIDVLGVSWDKVGGLLKTNPYLKTKVQSPTGAIVIFMRTDKQPFSDVKVRQALSMGIDRETIINDYFLGNAIIDAWPCLPSNPSGYTAYADMPESAKKLFQYRPTEAKALLAEAGYPNGLNFEVIIYQSPVDQDQLQLVTEQWKTIGVNATIRVVEGATHSALIYGGTYPDMAYSYWGNGSPQSCWGWAHGGVTNSIYNFSKVVDPVSEENFLKWQNMTDTAAANALLKADYLRQTELVWEIPLATPAGSKVWQPYLKGFSGESNMGLTSEMGNNEMYKFLWVDQTLKATYK